MGRQRNGVCPTKRHRRFTFLIMKTVQVSDSNWDKFFKEFKKKLSEANKKHVIVHTSIFFDRINEEHTGVVFYYE